MSTAVERPIPVEVSSITLPDPQQRPARHSVEVIEISDGEDDAQAYPESQPLRREGTHHEGVDTVLSSGRNVRVRRENMNPPETINLMDSDDEDVVQILPSRTTRRGRRFFSPPPPVTASQPPPPVPPIPRRYDAPRYHPMRLQPFPSPPVVRPIDRAFDFEVNPPTTGPPRENNGSNAPNQQGPASAQQAAARSHHVPLMGFGGALISQNRQRGQERHQRAQENEGGFFNTTASILRRVYGLGRGDPARPPARDNEDELLALQLLLEDGLQHRDMYMRFDTPAFLLRRQQQMAKMREEREAETYKQSYTHPRSLQSGFTFDFDPPVPPPAAAASNEPIIIDDDNEASTSQKPPSPPSPLKLNTMLVCARCLDPLVINGSLSSEQATLRRVWALQCGHVLDGKCLLEIGRPPYMEESSTSSDPKGKGKAKAVDEGSYQVICPPLQADQVPTPSPTIPPEDNSIRARLRSTTNYAAARLLGSSSSSTPRGPQPHPSKPSRGQKRKRGSNKKSSPKFEAQYLWSCPIPACERKHISYKVDGVWYHDGQHKAHPTETKFAIPIFA